MLEDSGKPTFGFNPYWVLVQIHTGYHNNFSALQWKAFARNRKASFNFGIFVRRFRTNWTKFQNGIDNYSAALIAFVIGVVVGENP